MILRKWAIIFFLISSWVLGRIPPLRSHLHQILSHHLPPRIPLHHLPHHHRTLPPRHLRHHFPPDLSYQQSK